MNPLFIPVIALLAIPVTLIGLPLARAFAARISQGATRPTTTPDVIARLERMEHAIDSIAIEVERISENQRFTTKLLSDRVTSAAADPSLRSG